MAESHEKTNWQLAPRNSADIDHVVIASAAPLCHFSPTALIMGVQFCFFPFFVFSLTIRSSTIKDKCVPRNNTAQKAALSLPDKHQTVLSRGGGAKHFSMQETETLLLSGSCFDSLRTLKKRPPSFFLIPSAVFWLCSAAPSWDC